MSKYLELVEGAFAQEHLDKQKNQNPYVAYSIKDGKVIYTIVPKEEGTMYTIYRVVNKDISNCTYKIVNLGLPSGIKWADRNVGASSPEHYGSYFQWGDTNAYTFDGAGEVTAAELASLFQPLAGDAMEITKDNVGMLLEQGFGITGTDLTNTPMGALGGSLDKLFNWDSYFDTTDGGSIFNKYNNSENGLTVLESGDNAATIHMGSQYRMPTSTEIQELINNTTQTFIDIDGNEYSKEQAGSGAIMEGKLKGVRFTSSNGNSIFIPAAGGCYESLLDGISMDGLLWSSSLYVSYGDYARNLYFNYGGYVNEGSNYRCYGLSVRGVKP